MAIAALGSFLLPTTINLLPAIIGAAGGSILLHNLGFNVTPLISPTPAPPAPAKAEAPVSSDQVLASMRSAIEASAGSTADKATAHTFVNHLEAKAEAVQAILAIPFSA